MTKSVTAPAVKALKGERKISVLTAYDYPTALLVDQSGIDVILVGDSLAMAVLGHEDTLSVTVDEMLHHTKAVSRAAKRALVVGDMPFMSYETGVEEALRNAGRFLKEGGARAVKLEGGARVLPQVRAMVAADIPVMGHIGLTPQSVAALGGFKVQGKTVESARALIEDAKKLADAGCFSIVLEAIPAPVAARITEAVDIPTIGIGAGPDCDGQVLVIHDILGLFEKFTPRFVKRYASLSEEVVRACTAFREEVEAGTFPAEEHCFPVDEEVVAGLYGGE